MVVMLHWDVLNLPSNRPFSSDCDHKIFDPPPFTPPPTLLPGTTEMDSCHCVSCIRMMSTREGINYHYILEWEASSNVAAMAIELKSKAL